ncbi:multimeric translocon complex in the outer envelope membrane 132 [Actinidia rufa]|uniref:Multimeric translocon complex in the outer envelope membrane 132 n=1 Tax=Actinidia rufa TaxID=165716 RepID=A0A7J0DA75_9ERIC|nr:multimeric translocon complex in the outer envelope membrane 132 [Actinidia rufa]
MPLEGSKATLEVRKLSRSEDSVRETGEKIPASATKKIEGAQLQQADKDAESNVSAKELENKGAKDEEDSANGESEENDETREKLQMIRVKFLRLAHRLVQTPHNVVVAQVLYRLGLAEQLQGRNGGRVGAFSFDCAIAMAEQLGRNFSISPQQLWFLEKQGSEIKVRVIDAPGLLPSRSDQRQNEKILHSIKWFIKKTPPNIVSYLERLGMQGRDFGDMPLLRTITEIFGPSIWFNAIVVLTHAESAPPESPNGTATSYDMFVTQRSHVVQQAIRQAAGDMRLMNPVSLVKNHSACRTNRPGQRVLPNGQVWKPHLLFAFLCVKNLAEANMLPKLQDSPPGKAFATRTRAPPLPFLLSSLLQSRPQLKLSEEQFGDDGELDDDPDESSDSDNELEYDKLPPFKRLTNDQLAMLMRMWKRKIPVPMPGLALPTSFDSVNPSYRFRHLNSPNQWVVKPVQDTHVWDHGVGYEGVNNSFGSFGRGDVAYGGSWEATLRDKDHPLGRSLSTFGLCHGLAWRSCYWRKLAVPYSYWTSYKLDCPC